MAVMQECSQPSIGLRSFGLTTADADRLSRFYHDAFGFEAVFASRRGGRAFEAAMGVDSGATATLLRLGESSLELLQFDVPGQPYPQDRLSSDLLFQHFAIVVTDIGDAYRHLLRIDGWTPISLAGPVTLPQSSGGVRAFKLRDPDGHPLELLEFSKDAMPSPWRKTFMAGVFLGIDHSATSVSNSGASIAFYRSLGFRLLRGSLNQGSEQADLDGCEPDVTVEVTSLALGSETPHLELLCYRTPSPRKSIAVFGNDTAATRLLFQVGQNRPSETIVDPDGHRILSCNPQILPTWPATQTHPTALPARSNRSNHPMTDEPKKTPVASTAPPVTIAKILTGQKALVTGANSGIGKGVAIALGQAGADVVVNYVDGDDAANAVVDEIRKSGAKAYAHKADVSSEEEVIAMFAKMREQFGTIDILVSNAGLQRDAPFQDMTLDKWNKVLSVNLTGQFLCAREAVREFLRRGIVPQTSSAAGKIICMSSVHQEIPWAGHANYATSKGGIKLMMESLAQEVAPHRIRVNAIAPGAIRTPINTSAWQTKEAYDRLMTLVPYGRIGEPEDIARAAVWLASDQSDYVVGTTLFVDGGMTLYPGFATGG